MRHDMDYSVLKGDNMKTTVMKLLAMSLVFVFIVVPATVSAGTVKDTLISQYKNSSAGLFVQPNQIPDWAEAPVYSGFDPGAWKRFPESDQFCSACSVKNATKKWNSLMLEQYTSPDTFPKSDKTYSAAMFKNAENPWDSVIDKKYTNGMFFGGAGGGAGAPSGGGCCG